MYALGYELAKFFPVNDVVELKLFMFDTPDP